MINIIKTILKPEAYWAKIDGNGITYGLKNETSGIKINIYELAFKCKAWAFDNGYQITSSSKSIVMDSEAYCEIIDTTPIEIDGEIMYTAIMSVGAKTELEVIFQATRWVIDKLEERK